MKPVLVSFGEIADSIPFTALGGYAPDIVVGIERGGLVLAGLVAFRLGVGVLSVRASLYDDSKPAKSRYDEPKVNAASLAGLRGKRVLVVDDVSRTGKTLKAVEAAVLSKGAKEVKSFVYAGGADFSCRPFDGCLVFPWEEGMRRKG